MPSTSSSTPWWPPTPPSPSSRCRWCCCCRGYWCARRTPSFTKRRPRRASPSRTDAPPRSGLRRPKPAQRIGEHRAAVGQAVAAFAEDELDLVAGELERRGHLFVGQRPAAQQDVRVSLAALHPHPDRFARRRADQVRIVVAAADGDERSAMTEHPAEGVGAIPGGGEGADAAATDAADGAPLRVGGQG